MADFEVFASTDSDGDFDVNQSAASAGDVSPDAFAFIDRTVVARSVTVESNTITVSGILSPVTMSIDRGEYRINGGSWTSYTTGNASLALNDTLQLRMTSSGNYATTVTTTVTVNASSFADWATTTVGAPAAVTTSDASLLITQKSFVQAWLGIGPMAGLRGD